MRIKAFIAMCVLSIFMINASVYKLPKTNINGNEYYYYKVQPKETIYSICKQLELKQSDMVKYNPSIAEGLKAGETLYFPVSDFTKITNPYIHTVKRGETIYEISRMYNLSLNQLLEMNPDAKDGVRAGDKLTIIPSYDSTEEISEPITSKTKIKSVPSIAKEDKGVIEEIAVEDDPFILTTESNETETEEVSEEDAIEEDAIEEDKTLTIALLMPFMLNEEVMSQTTRTYLDFYKGFLLAANDLKDNGSKIKICAYDTYNNLDSIDNILRNPEMEQIDAFVTPPGESQAVLKIAKYANLTGAYVFNPFYANDTTHISHKNVLQANITRDNMYEKAISRLIEEYSDYTPVIIGSPVNKNRQALVNEIKARYSKLGIKAIDIEMLRILESADLNALNHSKNYIFIPLSSSEKEFDKFIVGLKSFKAKSSGDIVLFGYPEWANFKESKLELLHSLNTVIYSRFFFDINSKDGKTFNDKFNNAYKSSMIITPPVQAALGYDSGYYLINALRDGYGNLRDANYQYEGIQCGYNFQQSNDGLGLENEALLYIYYRPNGSIEKVIF